MQGSRVAYNFQAMYIEYIHRIMYISLIELVRRERPLISDFAVNKAVVTIQATSNNYSLKIFIQKNCYRN